MTVRQRIAVVLVLVTSWVVSGCAPGQLTLTPTPIPFTATPSSLIADPTDTATPSSQIANPTETAGDFYSGNIEWWDNLKTCTPYVRSYLHPFLAVQEIDTIKGKDGDLCIVTQEAVGQFIFECHYTAEGIKTMTQDSFYQDARNKTMSTSGDDVNEVLSQQCTVTRLPTPTAP